MFLVPLLQHPRYFFNVLLPTVYGCALVIIYYCTFLLLEVLVLRPDQYLFEGPVTSEVSLNSILVTGVFDAFSQALNTWDDYVSHIGSSPWGSRCLAGCIGVL